ncbi:RHS repeat-associated core domain-containing protein [Acinetobacter courvalinii]|jgi:RHS repeat-associated protein|uniref:RHS repeat-associated core domain-containing protein n=1 Tax=Acinetobacter TaxID=469 RepID=UPI0021CD92A1|nr:MULTISPECIES: RHS repeat-associated core domain-containing protein [Acinetobacter]MCU4391658.1 RHS repeat-associated core domain-containing protein [Acinetobacter courvalinii]MDR2062829.1 RHS repeat-associated core domain-containing protein [Acinetobacter sp.]
MKLNKILVTLIFSCCVVSAHALITNSGETYEQSTLSVANKPINSCLIGINATSRQIELNSTDIQGVLPFSRSYNTSLQLGYRPEFRTDDGKSLDSAFAASYLENRALLGIGWSHNYDYKLTTFGNAQYNIYRLYILSLPGENYPITLRKQPNGTHKVISNVNDTNPSPDVEFSVSDDDGTNITIKRKGIEYTFKALSGSRNLSEKFYITKIKYPGNKIIDLTYTSYVKGKEIIRIISDISDNLGNKLKINYINLDGSDTSVLGQKLRGQISSVTTNSNPLNQQTVNYNYESFQYQMQGINQDGIILTQAVSTKNGAEVYNYNKNYVHKGLYVDRERKAPGVTIPILSQYSRQGTLLRTWEATENSIASYTDRSKDYGVLKFTEDYAQFLNGQPYYQRATLTLSPPSSPNKPLAAETFEVENGTNNDGPAIAYIATSTSPSCLTYNDKSIKNLLFRKDIRQLARVIDKHNNRTEFYYDNKNRVTNYAEAVGSNSARTTIATYTTDFDIPSTIKKGEITQTNTINALGQITESILSSTQAVSVNKTTQYTYYPNGLVKSINGPRNGTIDQVTYTYDNYGNKASESQMVKGIERKTSYLNYNSFGQPERILYPNGLVDQFFYNLDGTVQQKSHGSGSSTSNVTGQTWLYKYDELKRLINETNPDGELTLYDYDVLGHVIQTKYPDGGIRTINYFGNGIIQAEELWDSSKNKLVKASYQNLDSNGRITRTQSGVNGDWFWINKIYDLNGNLLQTQTSEGLIERWEYDALNRNTAHIDKAGNYNRTNYDALDNVISATDAVGSGSFPLNYRNGNALINERNKDFGFTGYYLNEADLINRITRGDDEARRCDMPDAEIDALERVGHKICSPSAGPAPFNAMFDYIYSYDQSRFGRLDKVTTSADMGVNTSYSYDLYDRPISKTQLNKWGAPVLKPLTISYGYSIGGKLNSITLPSGRKINYKYDIGSTGRLISVDVANTILINNINFNPAGEMIGWSWGNGGRYYWANDPALNDLVIFVVNRDRNNNSNFDLLYGYDRDGRIRKKTTDFSKIDDFDYHPAGYLNSETRSANGSQIYNITYSYDNNGNRKTLRAIGAHQQIASTVDYGYNGNRLNSLIKNGVNEPLSYYNPIGNTGELIGRYSTAQSYDGAGRLAWERGNNGKEWDIRYNHKNERTLLGDNTGSNGGPWLVSTVRQFVYDEESHLIGEYDSNGTALVEYIWLDDKPIAVIMGSGASAKLYYIVNDAQNTPRRLIDPSNDSVVWAWDSTAFGVAPPSIELVKFNLRFPGQYYDTHSGLFYNHNRYYNPELGRYMQPDPIGLEGGSNPYIYAGSNPVMNVDPNGLEFSNSLYNFAYNTSYAINDGLTFGLWTNFNNWYYGGTGGYNSNSVGANTGVFLSMAFTGPSNIVKKGVVTGVSKYEVGSFNVLKGNSIVGDGLDIHHLMQKNPAKQVIPNYDPLTAPSIALPRGEHAMIPTLKGEYTGSPRSLLAKDIMDMRNYTSAPNRSLIKLIEMNKQMYPTAFTKGSK